MRFGSGVGVGGKVGPVGAGIGVRTGGGGSSGGLQGLLMFAIFMAVVALFLLSLIAAVLIALWSGALLLGPIIVHFLGGTGLHSSDSNPWVGRLLYFLGVIGIVLLSAWGGWVEAWTDLEFGTGEPADGNSWADEWNLVWNTTIWALAIGLVFNNALHKVICRQHYPHTLMILKRAITLKTTLALSILLLVISSIFAFISEPSYEYTQFYGNEYQYEAFPFNYWLLLPLSIGFVTLTICLFMLANRWWTKSKLRLSKGKFFNSFKAKDNLANSEPTLNDLSNQTDRLSQEYNINDSLTSLENQATSLEKQLERFEIDNG